MKLQPSEKLRRNSPFFIRRRLVIILCLLLIIPTLFQIRPASGSTIRVPDDITTIQQAVNIANAGDTIQIAPDKIYYEHVEVTKSLTIAGENPQTTIVDGTANGTVFYLEASNIHITGMTIRNAGDNNNAITAENVLERSDHHQIYNNIITTSLYGVFIANSHENTIFNNTLIDNAFGGISLNNADNTNITGNTIKESEVGIKLTTSLNNIIKDNTVSQTAYAVHITSSSTGNIIRRNILSGQTGGLYSSSDNTTADHNTIIEGAYGLYYYNCKNGSVYYNSFLNNSYGIRIYMSSSNSNHSINNNKILNTYWAIELVNAHYNTITGNWLQQNTRGMYMSFSSFNTIYHNNFVQNTMQAYSGTGTGNLWDEHGEGNYWSDYEGTDDNGDTIGDTPYRITPIGYDNYPLMDTWSEHDILIANVTTSTNRTYTGSIVNINITVKNKGKAGISETFTVTAKCNDIVIETRTVTNLAPEENRTLTFNWNTAEVIPRINYTISAEASTVPDELNTDNNKLTDGKVYVKLMGDVNDDGTVDIFDIGSVSAHWYPGPPVGPLGYDPEADLNNDGAVDIYDIGIVSDHMGETA